MTRSRLSLLLLLSTIAAGCAQSIAVTVDSQEVLPEKAPASPLNHEARKVVAPSSADTTIPPVLLSKHHAQWCTKHVGDAFPEVQLEQLDGQPTKLNTLLGKRATLILFWCEDRWMSQMALEDLQHQVVAGGQAAEIAVIGISVKTPVAKVQGILEAATVEFPQLLDTEGTALAQVGSVALPRIYLLDPEGKILWFDIEYSESTRRELMRCVAALGMTKNEAETPE